jgi:hypothetical protein
LDDYLQQHTPEGQEILRQVVQALASTRQFGKVAPSVVNAQARKWSRFPVSVVLKACRIYLGHRYAEEGKGEAYLLGIIRQEAKRTNGHGEQSDNGQDEGRPPTPQSPAPKTAGQRAIERALADLHTTQEPGR